MQSLIVLLLDHEPNADEIRRIQAQANQRESLSLLDQQEQLRDCWEARAGLPEPDRIDRGVRRPRHRAQARAQPAPPARAPRPDPRPRRRAPSRRADLGDDGQPPRRHARDHAAAHQRGREADHQHRPARQGAPGPRGVRAPHRRRGRAHVRRPDRRRRDARRRRADRARPRAPRHPGAEPDRRNPRLRARPPRRRARHAQRPREIEGAEDPHHRRRARPRPQRPLRLRPRPRAGLRRRDLGHRPGIHARPRPRTARGGRRDAGPRGGVLRRSPPR